MRKSAGYQAAYKRVVGLFGARWQRPVTPGFSYVVPNGLLHGCHRGLRAKAGAIGLAGTIWSIPRNQQMVLKLIVNLKNRQYLFEIR